MNREEIIRMARGAVRLPEPQTPQEEAIVRALAPIFERFGFMVAAAEREKLAAWMMRQGYATGHGDTTEDLLKELDWQIEERIRNEREACAKACDAVQKKNEDDGAWMWEARNCAAAIRARGEK